MGKEDDYQHLLSPTAIPSFFKCPISLDLMKSPVSLCTGVTYDRASIQRWLDSGHDTCPATMQLLNSKDLIPNHTVHRLIQLWSPPPEPEHELEPEHDLLSLSSHTRTRTRNQTLSVTFEKLHRFAAESTENRTLLASNNSLLDLLTRIVSDPDSDSDPGLVESGLKLMKMISPKLSIVLRKSPDFLSSISRFIKSGRPDSITASAELLESIAPDSESKKTVFDNEELISELLRVLNLNSELQNSNYNNSQSASRHKSESRSRVVLDDLQNGNNNIGNSRSVSRSDGVCGDLPNGNNNQNQVVESILSALVSLASPRRNKLRFIRLGGVRIVSKIVRLGSNAAVEMALTMLEMAAGSGEGRAAIVEEAACVAAVVEKLMKGSPAANEHGVALLWSLCYFFRDRRAKEEVLRSCNNGGLGFMKVLLLMQSDCSPVVKRMCCDLLRIFRVNSKSSCTISSYDTKTTHIMPC